MQTQAVDGLSGNVLFAGVAIRENAKYKTTDEAAPFKRERLRRKKEKNGTMNYKMAR